MNAGKVVRQGITLALLAAAAAIGAVILMTLATSGQLVAGVAATLAWGLFVALLTAGMPAPGDAP